MPLGFGPAPGPRQTAEGQPIFAGKTESLSIFVTVESDGSALADLLPSPFRLDAPRLTVGIHRLRNIEWLGGRGYNIAEVRLPVVVDTAEGPLAGDYLSVLWENRADPIMTGREELGWAKLFADIDDPCPHEPGDTLASTVSWDGHRFLGVEVTDVEPARIAAGASRPRFHFKYIPSTGRWGQADVAQPVMTPAEDPARVVQGQWTGRGSFAFEPATFLQLPTMHHIINKLASLPIGPAVQTTVLLARGGKTLRDQVSIPINA